MKFIGLFIFSNGDNQNLPHKRQLTNFYLDSSNEYCMQTAGQLFVSDCSEAVWGMFLPVDIIGVKLNFSCVKHKYLSTDFLST